MSIQAVKLNLQEDLVLSLFYDIYRRPTLDEKYQYIVLRKFPTTTQFFLTRVNTFATFDILVI